ncbi:NUDIX domain-containing protein [Kocuria coralli]|uniref:NUDIX domain-containing protein n=1 Tax=Kocuria coralli TaxID=1461025 RepID=A0A5J5KXT9_9MICC|nr:NUDIX hydrolase [Kocuria coralli]KAA9393705.1 NUDIX domain-containing protein [Kocuria coralli]
MSTRPGAYAVVIEHDRILLSRWVPSNPDMQPSWTLPGGGMEAEEQPADTAIREVFEETGYTVELQELLGVSSFYIRSDQRQTPGAGPLHALRIVYRGRVTGGTLTPEVGGSSDDARWIPLDELDQYPHLDLVRVGLDLAKTGATA